MEQLRKISSLTQILQDPTGIINTQPKSIIHNTEKIEINKDYDSRSTVNRTETMASRTTHTVVPENISRYASVTSNLAPEVPSRYASVINTTPSEAKNPISSSVEKSHVKHSIVNPMTYSDATKGVQDISAKELTIKTTKKDPCALEQSVTDGETIKSEEPSKPDSSESCVPNENKLCEIFPHVATFETIIHDLGILGKLEISYKLRLINGRIAIDDRILQPLQRMWTGDDHVKTMVYIEKLISDSELFKNNLIKDILEITKKHTVTELSNSSPYRLLKFNLNTLIEKLRGADSGLKNLRITYQYDINIGVSFDEYIRVINRICDDANKEIPLY